MYTDTMPNSDDFDLSFKVFHELMAQKVTEILLISSPYEAFIMEEEGRLAERIIYLMIQNTSKHLLERQSADSKSIDRRCVWYGNTDLLLLNLSSEESNR